MAENESTTKVEKRKSETADADVASNASSEASSEDMLSLENLDSVLAEEDPDFAKSLVDIGPDDPTNAEIYNEDIVLEYTIEDEVKLWAASGRKGQLLARVFPFLPRMSYKIKIMRSSLRLSWVKWRQKLVYNITHAGPLLLAALKNSIQAIKSGIIDVLVEVKSFSLLKKAAFFGLVLGTVAAGYVVFRVANHKLLPHEQDLFMSSLEDWAQAHYQINPDEQLESFYESTRTSQNIIALKKMIVNLRRTAGPDTNPMGAFEFYVEGTVSEGIIEIKDREPEIGDLFLRTIEEMTFDQLSTAEGKQLLCDRLRKEVNKVLTKGKVRRVFYKSIIIKP